MAPIL